MGEVATLDARLQEAARAGDTGALAQAYRHAAEIAAEDRNPDAAGFFLTHAYVWALVAGDEPGARTMEQALRRQGRLD